MEGHTDKICGAIAQTIGLSEYKKSLENFTQFLKITSMGFIWVLGFFQFPT